MLITGGGNPAPKPPPPGPTEGFLVAFGPIDGLTNTRALPKPYFFQCPPLDTFPTDFTWTWNDFGTINGGMHSNPNYPALTTLQFDSLFVLDDGFANDIILARSQESMFERGRVLKALGDSMTPFAVQVGAMKAIGEWEPLGRRARAQLAVTMRAFHWETRSDEPDARYFTVQLTEFADAPLIQKIIPPKLSGTVPQRGPTTPARHGTTAHNGQRYVAVLDPNGLNENQRTLKDISIWAYGGSAPWRLILKASGSALSGIGPNDNLREKLGKRQPAVKIKVPWRQKGDM